jgi:RNA polymerase sigma-70 factor (ECF subfamily)
MQALPESDVVRQARSGDRRAFEDLLRPNLRPGARLAFGMLHDREAAEDAVQEAALKAWRRLGNLRLGAPFRPWFLGIVANECRKARTRRWWSVLRQPELEAQASVDRDPTATSDLRRALDALSPDQRAAVLMHFYLDLPLSEVASALGLRESGVKSRINRGLKRLRPLLVETATS